MNSQITADDLMPLLAKLPHDQQLRLAKLALWAASTDQPLEAKGYAIAPGSDEFSSEEELLAWQGEGWESFYAPR